MNNIIITRKTIWKKMLIFSLLSILVFSILTNDSLNFNTKLIPIESVTKMTDNDLTVKNPIIIYRFNDIAIKDSLAFLIQEYIIITLNISNPSNPEWIGNYQQFPYTCFGVGAEIEAIDDNLAIILNADYFSPQIGIQIYNYTNLNNWSIQSEKEIDYGFSKLY